MGLEEYRLGLWNKDLDDERLWQQAADLMYGAFDWPISKGVVKRFLAEDPRNAVDPVATYATDAHGDLAGYVGIARRPVVHQGEVLPSGHLWSVAVRQDQTRKGLGKALLKMAVELLHAEGNEVITLYSTPGLVAYPVYRSLGFLDHHRLAFWLAEARPGEPQPDLRPLTEDEMARAPALFHERMRGLDGFSVREGDPYAGYKAMGIDMSKWMWTIDQPGTFEGFVNMSPSPNRGLSMVTEIVGPDGDWYRQAIEAVTARVKGDQVWVTHRNPLAADGLEAAGFRWNDVHAFERMMAVGPIIEEDETFSDPGWFTESRNDVF